MDGRGQRKPASPLGPAAAGLRGCVRGAGSAARRRSEPQPCVVAGRDPRQPLRHVHGAARQLHAGVRRAAWHWVAPAVRYRHAHELLAPGGHTSPLERLSHIPGRFARSSTMSAGSTPRSAAATAAATGHPRPPTGSPTTPARSWPAACSTTCTFAATCRSSATPPTRALLDTFLQPHRHAGRQARVPCAAASAA